MKMKPLQIDEYFSNDQNVYAKIKIKNLDSTIHTKTLIQILTDLEIQEYLNTEPELASFKYRNWIGRHEFYESKCYTVHVIYSDVYLYLIFIFPRNKKRLLIKVLNRYCRFKNSDKASDKQIFYLKRMGVSVREGLSKREASKMIDELKK